jgi:acyl-CoA reductase-like NAD-dependent aldehyde dehydrogenase
MNMNDTGPTPRKYAHFINGRWAEGQGHLQRRAPGTGLIVAEFTQGSAGDIDAAVHTAREAFDEGVWANLPGLSRARLLYAIADGIDKEAVFLAQLDAEESGKPIKLAVGDIAGAADLFRYAASLATMMHGTTYTNNGADFTGLVLREPAGVAALITPWNFPALIFSQKVPFALASGCTVVVKPSEMTSSSSLEIARIATESGLPDGVLNVVTGDGTTGALLTSHPAVDVVSFTGSTATGRQVIDASKATLKKLSLELGGKAANIVFEDADLEDAAEGVVHGVFFNNGECCVSQSRLLVQDSVADDFIAEVRRRTATLRLGQPLDDATDVGAMIHEGHLDAVLANIEGGVSEGADVVSGGQRGSGGDLDRGLFVEPTVLDRITPAMAAFHREIFGPVLTVTRFTTTGHALELANAVEYGLSNSVWSKNIDKVLETAKGLKSGTVYVNTTIDAPPSMPFGGYKSSGTGREMGEAGFEEFTELKSVNIRTGKRAGTFSIGGRTS